MTDADADVSTESEPKPEPELEVLYRDDALVVVNKPSGYIVHRGWGQDEKVMLTWVRDLVGQYVYPVHRLDRGTSGVLVFALSSEFAQMIQEDWSTSEVTKSYWALVRGRPPTDQRVDYSLRKEYAKKSDRPKLAPGEVEPRYPAITDFRNLIQFGRYALVEASPQTGRTHQIRRHAKHQSWHLIGDVRYGKGEHNRFFRTEYGLHRLALHAVRLAMPHPVERKPLEFFAPLPFDFAEPLRRLARASASQPEVNGQPDGRIAECRIDAVEKLLNNVAQHPR